MRFAVSAGGSGRVRREGRDDCGKGNRVLHTEQFPKKGEMGLTSTAWEDYRVRFSDEEIGLTSATRRHHLPHESPNHLRPMSAAVSLVRHVA